MVVRAFLFASIAFLAACGTTPTAPTIVPAGVVETLVPVPTCGSGLDEAITKSKHVNRPLVLPISQLTEQDTENFQKVQSAYISTIAMLVKYAQELEANQTEIQMQCKVAKEEASKLNTSRPTTLSTPK